MANRLDRFRQLEKPRERSAEGPERTSTSGRIDAVLGPGEKAPAVPVPPPCAEPTAEGATEGVPLSPEALAMMKGKAADLEAALRRELDREPMHAGKQITLFRILMRRSVEELEGSHAGGVAFGVALVLTAFTFGSCVVMGPRLWQLLPVAGIVILLLRWHGVGGKPPEA